MQTLRERLLAVRETIRTTAERVGRDPRSITLVAVSKTQSVEAIREALAAGQTVFGENYAQELKSKVATVKGLLATDDRQLATAVEWHFIGHLQRNKVKDVVPYVHWIHTIDSAALAQTIATKVTQPVHCCIEVNVGGEPTKHGITPETIPTLVREIAQYPNVRLEGLMAIPPNHPDPEASRPYFRQLAQCLAELNQRGDYPRPLHHLSMGMTNDFAIAIEEGTTIVRVGTAIFGERATACARSVISS